VICNPTDSETYTGSIGLPLPNVEIRILDDQGNDVPLGEAGEIAIRGPQVMQGYWQRPDETALKLIEFRDDLPKTNVGKILRRELRDSVLKKAA